MIIHYFFVNLLMYDSFTVCSILVFSNYRHMLEETSISIGMSFGFGTGNNLENFWPRFSENSGQTKLCVTDAKT